jgi:hypothetical protein
MIRFIKTRPGTYLVVGKRGTLRNLGVGAAAWVGPGTSFVKVPSGKEEAAFSMVQETADGIPLRFKGSVVYHVVDPVAAALAFTFEGESGSRRLRGLVADVCLGELRDVVSHMTMRSCIEERKTTLTSAVAKALATVLGDAESGTATSWGIAVDLVLVAQVFVVDEELRARLEAEERAAIATRSRRAEVLRDEEIERIQIESRRRLEAEGLEQARESHDIRREKMKLEQDVQLAAQAAEAQRREEEHSQQVELARRRAEAEGQEKREALEREAALALRTHETEAQRRRVRLEEEREVAAMALEVGERKLALEQLRVEKDMLRTRADAEVERDLLPQRQLPQIAEALAGIYQGATLSIYGAEDALGAKLLPLFDHVIERVRHSGGRDEA